MRSLHLHAAPLGASGSCPTHRSGQATLIHIGPVRGDPLQPSPPAHGARGAGHHVCVREGGGYVVVLIRRRVVVMGMPSGRGLAPRRQAEGLLQQQVHLMSHLVDGGLRAQAGGLGVAFQAPSVRVSPRPHQAVHVRFLDQLGLGLKHSGTSGQPEPSERRIKAQFPELPHESSASQLFSQNINSSFPQSQVCLEVHPFFSPLLLPSVQPFHPIINE